MCKIITIINNGKGNEELVDSFLTLQEESLALEPHGYSVYSSTTNITTFYENDKDYLKIDSNIKYDGSQYFMIHARTATGGEYGKDGLHLQRFNGNVWAHNGMCRNINNKDKSDSYYFFEGLLSSKITAESVSDHISKTGFWGRGFVYNKRRNKLHVFMNSKVFVTALSDTCIAITTYEPPMVLSYYEDILGMAINRKTKMVEPYAQLTFDDRLLIFQNGYLVHEESIKKAETKGYQGAKTYDNGYTYNGDGYGYSSSRLFD